MRFKDTIRKSSLKAVESQKFIPINLHLEQFLVEKYQTQQSFNALNTLNEKRAYNFTSVGAFTTVHTNKPTNAISIDQLMINDKLFKFKSKDLIDFKSEDTIEFEPIENEILLNFYSLKLFIELGEDLKYLKRANIDKEKVNFQF